MRIRTILTAAAAPAIITAGLLATAAAPAAHAATNAGPGTSNSQQGHITGKNAISYNDGVFGPVQVNETQHPAFDTVSAKFTGGQTMTPGATSTVGWNSDFVNSTHPSTGTLTYTINADGTGYTGQATYPAS